MCIMQGPNMHFGVKEDPMLLKYFWNTDENFIEFSQSVMFNTI